MTQHVESNINITDKNLINFTPGTLRVIKREGHVVEFDSSRIKTALKNAFIAVEGQPANISEKIQTAVEQLSVIVVQKLRTTG